MDSAGVQNELALQSVNRRLAELLHTDALPLAGGGGQSLRDPLWVWGIVGGKEVGKSTLINALAGGDVVDRGEVVGEGTRQPAAYLTSGDLELLRARFDSAGPIPITYHTNAPDAMRTLVLVDLPDFDSLYANHLEIVRSLAGALDGIIWVTTPKKVGDLRAMREIRRVLKARANFAYVVNKMDWLLAQSNEPPRHELKRAAMALQAQVDQCDPDDSEQRTFLIAAKYTTEASMLAAIARSRGDEQQAPFHDANGEMTAAVTDLLGNFTALKSMLTTTPTAETATANKQANLRYQVRTQAGQLLDHYQPTTLVARFDRALGSDPLRQLSNEFFPIAFCGQVIEQLNDETTLVGAWSAKLFRRRITRWPLLGLIAWPLASVGAALSGLRGLIPTGAPREQLDPFRVDGIALEERVDGVLSGVRGRLGTLTEVLHIEHPAAVDLARQFRRDVAGITEESRRAVLQPYLARSPGLMGRAARWVLPIAVLLWFPLIQPIAVAVLRDLSGGAGFNIGALLPLVEALSAGHVLTGLLVGALVLSALTGAVYSRAVRDAMRALDDIQGAHLELVGEPLHESLLSAVVEPSRRIRDQLAELTAHLERLRNEDPPDRAAPHEH